MLRLILAAALTLLLAPSALAFGNFFNFPFGHQQQQQQPQQRPRREHPGWDMLHDGKPSPVVAELTEVHCRAGYVCPGSLVCVPTPADCPCPYP